MKIDDLTVALRPRSAWEAVELGTALTRRHAGAIWKPWLALTLPVLVLVNAFAWAIDALWLAGLVMWWLKPAFDRVPLYVLSRAVFGDVPTPRQTLQAQRHWGLRWLLPYLAWRRLGPVRSLYLPVDLLEGGRGREAGERRRALGAPVYGVGMMLTLVCLHFEAALYLGGLGLVMLFIPGEYLTQIGPQLWQLLQDMPVWLAMAFNAAAWAATSLIEPFYIGAGFGLYLNRRTEIEAWDIELALRRLGARLTHASSALVLGLAFVLAFAALPGNARAQQTAELPPSGEQAGKTHGGKRQAGNQPAERTSLQQVFGRASVDDRRLRKAVATAYADPTVSPKRRVATWKARDPKKPDEKTPPLELRGLGQVLSLISEYGLWVVFGAIVLALALTSPRWLRWFRDGVAREGREPDELRRAEADEALPPLPEDIPTAVRRLWQDGRQREALALMYRASVEAMVARTEAVLVPGATESECLRASRKLARAEERDAFARAVRTWQHAAYAQRFPGSEEFESLLAELARRFAWTPMPGGAGVAA